MRPSVPSLLAVVALAAATLVATPATASPSATDTEAPIALIPGDAIFTGALEDLSRTGYRESEYVVTLTDPSVYAYVGDTTEVTVEPAPESPQGEYRSRMIVRIPQDAEDFNGRVLVEMMNTTATVDLDIAWQQASEYLMREGWAYIGVTVQQTGLNSLNSFRRQPDRYTGLGLNLQVPEAVAVGGQAGVRDPSLAWDLVGQIGRMIADGQSGSPLTGYEVTSTYLTGQSQMAGYAVTYVNAVHPVHQVYDGFLVAYRGTRATNLQFEAPVDGQVPSTSASEAQRTVNGGGTPVIVLQTESDPIGSPGGTDSALWRPDADTPNDRYRLWEVAGAAHNDEHGARQALGVLGRDFGLPFSPACDWTAPTGVNRFPMRFAWNAALDSLGAWVEDDIAPATAPRIRRDGTDIVRNDRGNARGGLRLPPIEVQVARYGPASTGGLFCNLTGFQRPFSMRILNARYPSVEGYVERVRAAALADVADGFLLALDAEWLIREAAKGPRANGETTTS